MIDLMVPNIRSTLAPFKPRSNRASRNAVASDLLYSSRCLFPFDSLRYRQARSADVANVFGRLWPFNRI